MLCACLFATAAFSTAANENTRILIKLTGNHQKQQFAAAKHLIVTKANVANDIFTAGQYIHFDSVSAKSIIAAAMSLSLQKNKRRGSHAGRRPDRFVGKRDR